MAILVTNKKASLERLADQLLTKRASDSQRADAVRALRAANPGLTGSVAKGTPIVLPDLPHLRAKIDVGALVGAGRLDALETALAHLPESMTERAATVQARSKQLPAELKKVQAAVADADVKRFLTKTRIAAVSRRAKEDADEATALAKAFEEAAPRWAEDLKKLKALLLRTG